MSEIIIALIGILSIIISSIASFVLAKKAGIGPFQDTLVSTLKNLTTAQGDEISSLKTQKVTQDERIKALEQTVEKLQIRIDELEELTVSQAILIQQLTPKKRRVTTPTSLDE